MKKLFLLLMPITLILCGCSTQVDNCQKYAEWYCNASIWVAHYPKVVKVWRDKDWYGIYVCRFSCAEIVLVEETEDF